MAGTETKTETEEIENTSADRASVVDDDHSAYVAARGAVDGGIHNLTISELHSRVHTGRTWRAQGMVEGEPLEIVRNACREFLESTEDDAAELAGTPYVPKNKPCADCKGIDLHKPTCAQVRR